MPLILQENFTVRLVEMMRTGEIDVAILADPFDTTGLDTLPLYDEDFVVAVPKKHHWTKKQQIASVDLKQETMLLLGVGHCFRDQVLEVCPEAARFAANSAGIQKTFEGSSLETIRHMVAEGLGITVLPRMSVSLDDDPLLKFITFAPPVPNRRIVLAWRKSFSRDRAVDALHEVIHSVELPGCKKL
jgi:LysR family hydrogen peroxide-inducible transcriptional activator